MFLDQRLWKFTEGVRLRIVGAMVVGLLASAVGIVRLGLLGWLLGRIFSGDDFAALLLPLAAVAGVMVLRGVLEYWRTTVAHETAARVQRHLRMRLYRHLVALGPAHFGLERTGDVLLSVVEGVERLEIYFGQYLPQLFVAALTPVVVFIAMASLDLPVAAALLGFTLLTLIAPSAFHRFDMDRSGRRQRAYSDFAAEFLDAIQGLATLKAFGQSGARGRILAEKAHEVFRATMWVLATNSLARGITDTGLAVGAAVSLAIGAYRVETGEMSLEVLLVVLMIGTEVFRPQRDLRAMLHDGMMGQSAAEGILSVLGASPAIVHDEDRPRLAVPPRPQVRFEGVRFAYPGGKRPGPSRCELRGGRGRAGRVRRLQRRRQVDGGKASPPGL